MRHFKNDYQHNHIFKRQNWNNYKVCQRLWHSQVHSLAHAGMWYQYSRQPAPAQAFLCLNFFSTFLHVTNWVNQWNMYIKNNVYIFWLWRTQFLTHKVCFNTKTIKYFHVEQGQRKASKRYLTTEVIIRFLKCAENDH